MDRHTRIISLLTKEFQPSSLELLDQSNKHIGHAGASPSGETHYDLLIISEQFKGISKIKRHQAIYKALAAEFKSGLHALAIKAFSPEEF